MNTYVYVCLVGEGVSLALVTSIHITDMLGVFKPF